MPSCERIPCPSAGFAADAGIRRRYPIEEAAWVWHPGLGADEEAFCRFELDLACARGDEILLHVSADQRFELSLDGELVACGPDRSELGGWAFHAYRLRLDAGEHRLEALVWWLSDDEWRQNRRPLAQCTHRPAFCCTAEGAWRDRVATGSAPWRVRRVRGIGCRRREDDLGYHVIGPPFELDGALLGAEEPAVPPAVVRPPHHSETGEAARGWRCEPTGLPEQRRELVAGGRVVPVRFDEEGLCRPLEEDERWGAPARGEPVTVPAGGTVDLLWDLGRYECAYTRLRLAGGAGAVVDVAWAESLFEATGRAKGRRDQIAGKRFVGFGDRVVHDGTEREYRSPWWRSGRFLRLTVATRDEALTILDARPLATRYPVEPGWRFEADDAELAPVMELCERGLAMCMHETHVDCPYYEQMNYGGDTRVQLLVGYVLQRDDRLARRCIDLFARSRWFSGFVAERCPSEPYQLSLTYGLMWPLMLRDLAWWREAGDAVRAHLPALRGVMELHRPLVGEDGLTGPWPGWSFVDWVKGRHWSKGVAPTAADGRSCLLSLHLVLAAEAAAALEDAYGEAALAERHRAWAAALMRAAVERFWSRARGLLADDTDHRHFSEHAQCLALLCDTFPHALRERCLAGLIEGEDLAPCSVYFSYYLFEALHRHGRGDELHRRCDFWKHQVALGFTTTVERPEPSRSDCHGWGAHPLFHACASLAGVRPAAPGFARVLVAPDPGPLRTIAAGVPHPRGSVGVELGFEDGAAAGTVHLPPGVEGTFRWREDELSLRPGANRVSLAAVV